MRSAVGFVSIALALITAAVPALAQEPAARKVEFGLNSYLGNLGHTEIRGSLVKGSAADRTHYLDAVQQAGVSVVRETFLNWADAEPVRGQGYNLAPFDDLARKASKRGIEIIALAYPFPDWATGAKDAAPGTPFRMMYALPKREFEQDFRKIVATFVKRYSGQHAESIALDKPIRKWIFSNELDAFADITPDEYAFWLRAFSEEVKKVDAGATVATMGFRYFGGNVKFFDEFLESQLLQGPGYPYFDVIGFHVYPHNYDPNIYVMNVNAGFIRRSLAKHKLTRPLWLLETGDKSKNERLQASNVIKYMIHGASVEGVTRVHMHGIWDIMKDEDWGVLAHTPSGEVPRRKASFRALQVFLQKVSGNEGVYFLGPGRYRVAMPKGQSLFVVWSEGDNTTVADLLCGVSRVRVTSLSGEVKESAPSKLSVSAEPVFVEKLE